MGYKIYSALKAAKTTAILFVVVFLFLKNIGENINEKQIHKPGFLLLGIFNS